MKPAQSGRGNRGRDTGYRVDGARIYGIRPPIAKVVPLGNKIADRFSQH